MPLYLSRFSYTPETWARLIGNPEDRRTAAQSYIESVGGKLHGFWYAFGSHDGYNLWEAPDNVSMAAVALAIGGGGALSSFETTVLMSVDETMDALRKAQEVQYRAPAAAPDSGHGVLIRPHSPAPVFANVPRADPVYDPARETGSGLALQHVPGRLCSQVHLPQMTLRPPTSECESPASPAGVALQDLPRVPLGLSPPGSDRLPRRSSSGDWTPNSVCVHRSSHRLPR
jgi:uncharacterized protein with GYD domain